jgi:hypothetical protein
MILREELGTDRHLRASCYFWVCPSLWAEVARHANSRSKIEVFVKMLEREGRHTLLGYTFGCGRKQTTYSAGSIGFQAFLRSFWRKNKKPTDIVHPICNSESFQAFEQRQLNILKIKVLSLLNDVRTETADMHSVISFLNLAGIWAKTTGNRPYGLHFKSFQEAFE